MADEVAGRDAAAKALHMKHGLDCAYQAWDGNNDGPHVLESCGACQYVADAAIIAYLGAGLEVANAAPPTASKGGRGVRLAYADPPYLGCCGLYGHHHEAPYGCWDDERQHFALMGDLDAEYDGWAVSASSPSLTRLLFAAPEGIRIASWCKSFASFKPSQRVAYAWEPVIYKTARGINEGATPGRDFLVEPITLKRGLTGAKPEAFCRWVASVLLGYVEGDELVDIFPGTGVMERVLAQGVLL